MAVKWFNNAFIATLSVSQLGILSPTESRHFPLSSSPCSAAPSPQCSHPQSCRLTTPVDAPSSASLLLLALKIHIQIWTNKTLTFEGLKSHSNSPCSAHPVLSSTVMQAHQSSQAASLLLLILKGRVLLSDLKMTQKCDFWLFRDHFLGAKFGAGICYHPLSRLTHGCSKQRISISISV